MNDMRELLEMAAKAAGIEGEWDCSEFWLNGTRTPDNDRTWNPLDRDGDSARLEAALNMHVTWSVESVFVGSFPTIYTEERYADHGGDKQAARRVAGVKTAATIGKAMP